jgi:hypothetical protein
MIPVQIHFGSGAARIRNDFFPDPDPQHCMEAQAEQKLNGSQLILANQSVIQTAQILQNYSAITVHCPGDSVASPTYH